MKEMCKYLYSRLSGQSGSTLTEESLCVNTPALFNLVPPVARANCDHQSSRSSGRDRRREHCAALPGVS